MSDTPSSFPGTTTAPAPGAGDDDEAVDGTVDTSGDENAVDDENENYIGVDPIYKNHADGTHEPLPTGDADADADSQVDGDAVARTQELEQAAIEREKNLATEIGPTGAPLPTDDDNPIEAARQRAAERNK